MTPNLKKKTAVKVDKKDKFCWNEVNSSCNGGFTVNKKKKNVEGTKQLMQMKRDCDKWKFFYFPPPPGFIGLGYCISVGDCEFARSITQGNNSERLVGENQLV